MIKGQEALKLAHEDNYDEILSIFQYGTAEQASSVKPDMERAIAKGGKVIKEHSMMIRGSQKNKLIDDSYLLIGKGYYFMREYLDALETFNYVIQQFKKTDEEMEARIWAAKTETALGNYIGAKDRFEKVYRDPDLPKKLKGHAFAAFADLELSQKRYTGAYQLLSQAVEREKDKQTRLRWLFITGQLQAKLGNHFEATKIFEKVIKKGPPYELLLQAQLNKARYYDVQLRDPEDIFDYLRKMLSDEKNYDDRDAIYYVMAGVYERLENEPKQIESLKKSVNVSTTNTKQKTKSFLKLAEIHFNKKKYLLAQAYYDSTFQGLTENHPKYKEVELRKNSLGELVKQLNTITTQDSLLALAELSSTRQEQIIKDMIARKRKEDRKKREKEEQRQFALENTANSGSGGQASSSGGSNFYFYNTPLRASGVRDFQNRYGQRKLQDNWRLLGKGESSLSAANNQDEENTEGAEGKQDEGDDYSVETYQKNIPKTPEEKAAAHAKIQKAFLNSASIYREKLKDLKAAAKQLQELLKRYPQMDEIGKAWYSLYRIYLALEDEAMMKKYRELIFQNLPDSEYAELIKNKGKKNPQNESKAHALYVSAYGAYEQENFSTAYQSAQKGMQQFNKTEFGARFALLQAMAQGNLKNRTQFIKLLKEVIARYPQTEQAQQAQKILNQIGGSEKKEGDNANKSANEKSKYRLNPNADHKYLVIMPNEPKAKANKLTNGLVDFNKAFFPRKNLVAKDILMGRKYKVVVVSGFKSKGEAEKYIQTIKEQKILKNYIASIDYKHFVISNTNFATFYGEQDVEGYQNFYSNNYQN